MHAPTLRIRRLAEEHCDGVAAHPSLSGTLRSAPGQERMPRQQFGTASRGLWRFGDVTSGSVLVVVDGVRVDGWGRCRARLGGDRTVKWRLPAPSCRGEGIELSSPSPHKLVRGGLDAVRYHSHPPSHIASLVRSR